MRKLLTAAVMSSAIAMAAPASAATVWLDSQHGSGYYGNYSVGETLTFSGTDGVKVRASAWSINSSNVIRAASLGVWDQGLGVSNPGGDNSHTVDGSGWRDFILLQFDNVVELSNAVFNTGWDGFNDTDATIGYQISGLAFGTNPALNYANQSVLAAFNLYQSNAGNGNSGNSTRNINPNDYDGNLWLIGASFTNSDKKTDGFKLEKLTYDTIPAVPEPATWLMMILGFGLVGGVLRSQRREKLTVSYS